VSTDPDRALDRLLKAELRGQADPASPASASCIDAETLAAWADGALSSDQAQLVETHLADCARCQALMAAFARTEVAPAAVVPFRPKSPVRWLVPLAAGTIAASLLVWVAWPAQPEAPVPQMADAREKNATLPAAPAPTFAEPPPPAKETKLDKDKAEAVSKRQQAERRDEAQSKTAPAAGRVLGQQGQTGATGATGAATAPPPAYLPPPPVPPPPPKSVATPPTVTGATPPPPAQPPVATTTTAAANAAADANARLMSRAETVTLATVIAEFSSPDPALAQPVAGAGGRGGGGGGRGGGAAGAGTRGATSATFRATTPTRWRVLSSGAVERSSDAGTSWQPITIDPPTLRITNGSASPTACWLVGRDGVVLLSTDGTNFTRVTPPAPVDLASITATSPREATVRTSDGRTFITTDGGQTWTVQVPNL